MPARQQEITYTGNNGRGDAAFTLGNAGSVVDISTYEYTLLDNGNHSWSLAENRVQMPFNHGCAEYGGSTTAGI